MKKILNFFKSLSPLQKLFQYIIQRSLSSYIITEINYESLFVGGHLLKDLELNVKRLNKKLLKESLFILKKGKIKNLEVTIPWAEIFKKNTFFKIEEIEIILIVNKSYGRCLNEEIDVEEEEKNEDECGIKDEKDVFFQIVEKIFFNVRILCKEFKLVLSISDERKINFNFKNLSFEFKKIDMMINYILNIENIWVSLNNKEQIISNIEGIDSPCKNAIIIEAHLNRRTKKIQSIIFQIPLLHFMFEIDELIAFTDILLYIQNLFSFKKSSSKNKFFNAALQDLQILSTKEEAKDDASQEDDHIKILDLVISDYFKNETKNLDLKKIELDHKISNNSKTSQNSTSLVTKSKNNNELVEFVFEPFKNLIDDYYNACFEKNSNITEEGELSEEEAEILKNLVDLNKDGDKTIFFLNQKMENQLKVKIGNINISIFLHQNKGGIKKKWKGLLNDEIFPFLNERNQFLLSIHEVKFEGSLKLEEMRVYLSSFRFLNVEYENEIKNMEKNEENNDSFFSFNSFNNEDDNLNIKEIFAVFDTDEEENVITKKEWKLNDHISAFYHKIQLKKFKSPEKKPIEIIFSKFNDNCINLSILFRKKIQIHFDEKLLNKIETFLENLKITESKTNIKTEIINNEEINHNDSYPLSLSSFYSFENEFEKNSTHIKESNKLNLKFEIPSLEIILIDNSNTNLYINIEKLVFDSEDVENLKRIDIQIKGEIEFSFMYFTNNIINTSSFLKMHDKINNMTIKIDNEEIINHILHENNDDQIHFETKNKINCDVSLNKLDLYLNFEIFENYLNIINSTVALFTKCLKIILNLQKSLIIPKQDNQENDEIEKSLDFDMMEHNQGNKFLSTFSFRDINIFIGESLNIKKLITFNLNMLQLYYLENFRNEFFIQGSIFACYINLYNSKEFFFPYFDMDYCLSSRMNIEEIENYLIYKQANGIKEKDRFVKDFEAKKLLENKIDNMVVFSFNIYHNCKKKDSPLIERKDQEDILSDLNESSFDIGKKEIKLFFGLNSLILKPINLLLLSNSSIIQECKKLNERLTNKIIINESEKEASENISLQIEGNKICIDFFPFKEFEKSNLLHCSSVRSLINIDEFLFSFSSIDGESRKSVNVKEIQLFLWKIPNKIKINQTNLFVFQNLYDVENLINVYHKTVLEKFCFINIFILRNFEIQISKNIILSISKIEFELFEDSIFILSSHLQDLSEFLNILSESFINEAEEKKLKEEFMHEDSDSFEIDLEFFNSSNDEDKIDIEKIEHPMENSISKKELITLKIQDVKFNLTSGAQFTVMDDFLFKFTEIFEKEKSISILKSAIIPKYFSESRLNKKNEKIFSSLCRSQTTSSFFKNAEWQLQFVFKNFGLSANEEEKSEERNYKINLEKLKVFRLANNQKVKIFSKIKSEENNDMIFCELNFDEMMQLDKIYIKNSSVKILLDKNIIKNFNQIIKTFERNEKKKKSNISKKEDTFISFFKIDRFYISIDYDPNYEDLQNILRDPINIINIGKIIDLQIMCNSVCFRGINLEQISSSYFESLIEDIRCNQKTNIIKKLPYINQIFKAVDTIKSFMTDLKNYEQNEIHRLLNLLINMFYIKKE